jgi:periplasmic protein TonB
MWAKVSKRYKEQGASRNVMRVPVCSLLWISFTIASHSQTTAMTHKEILQANLLDIIFDNRNKEYGAYALRRGYNHRLLISLGAGLSVILFFILVNVMNHKDEMITKSTPEKDGVIIKQFEIPKEKKKEPEEIKEQPKQKPIQHKVEQVAKVEFKNLKIVPDDIADKKLVATKDDFIDKQIAKETTPGEPYKGIVPNQPVAITGTGDSNDKPQENFIPKSSDPEYPGGPEALSRFFSQNLVTPDDLNTGEKKMVKVRFKVYKDGSVTGFEIEQTGGGIFDTEVIRVCKKMRRWKPALQNGNAVAVSYVLPVTFVGLDQ